MKMPKRVSAGAGMKRRRGTYPGGSRWLPAAMAAMLCAPLMAGACAPIREGRGYIFDPTLSAAIQPGVDNRQSVEATMGRPTFVSQFGQPTWYYVSNTTSRSPFVQPRITDSRVMTVRFDAAGNVTTVDNSGMDSVVYIDPDGARTPTLGRERGFLEDLFGNIGTVGAPGAGPGGAGGPGRGPGG